MNFESGGARICVRGEVGGGTINVRPFLIYRSAELVGLVVNFNAWLFPLARPPVRLHCTLNSGSYPAPPSHPPHSIVLLLRRRTHKFPRTPHRRRNNLSVRLPGSDAYITSVAPRSVSHLWGFLGTRYLKIHQIVYQPKPFHAYVYYYNNRFRSYARIRLDDR